MFFPALKCHVRSCTRTLTYSQTNYEMYYLNQEIDDQRMTTEKDYESEQKCDANFT